MAAGVYLHIPFCKSRCSYCDFATDVYRDSAAVERYVEALCAELTPKPQVPSPKISGRATSDMGRETWDVPADTIYFGGGTPSLLAAAQVERIIDTVCAKFDIAPDAEITMEMNPATVSAETLCDYRSLGVNRASFGVQTFNDRDLNLLARGHNASDARKTFELLRKTGFDNISFDLIAGLPGQTMADWKNNLAEAIKLSPEHISLYLLEIHAGTPLAEQVRSGRRTPIDEELAAAMYEHMLERLAAAGYEQYEISNFAKPGRESRHNTKYWRLDPFYGFGVSAHSFDGQRRYANERDTAKYAELIETGRSPIVENNELDPKQLSGEFAFLNLRLTSGLDLSAHGSRFGFDLLTTYANEIRELEAAGLVRLDQRTLSLTKKGMLYSNEVFSIFV